jgi:hypothetical protein
VAAKSYQEAKRELADATHSPAPQLITRAFRMDTNTLASGMQNAFNLYIERMGVEPHSAKVQAAFKTLFGRLGISLSEPDAVFYNDLSGVLLVRATPAEQQSVAAVVEMLGGHESNLAGTGPAPDLRAGNP